MVLYAEGADGFVRSTLPAIEDALASEQPVHVLAGGERIARLRDALGDDAERVGFTDTQALGRNPARIIPAWRAFLAEHGSDGKHALGVSEVIWSGRTPAELTECDLHESLLDLAFADGPAWRLLCPYDLDGLEEQVIESARRRHAFLAHDGAPQSNDAYAERPTRPLAGELPPPLAPTRELAFAGEDLGVVRRFLTSWAEDERLGEDRTEELVLAVNELATNSIRYGGGHGQLRLWREGDVLLCEVRDDGHITDPLVGRARPRPEASNGRGLWLANQLCDLVQIRSSPEGSTVRVHKALG